MNKYDVDFILRATIEVDANNPTDAEEKAKEELDMEFGFSDIFLEGQIEVEQVKEVV